MERRSVKLKFRTRLLLFNLAVIAVATTLIVVGAYSLASYQMRQETRGFLSDEFGEYSHKYAAGLDDLAMLRKEMREHFTKARMTYPIICRIYSDDGREVVRAVNVSPGPDPRRLMIDKALAGEEVRYTLQSRDGDREFWCMIKPVRSPSGRRFAFELGLDVEHLHKRIRRLRMYLIMAVPIVLVVALGGAWWMARKSLQPVEE
ncbi:hypothetical protein LCGC14_2736450, partial [marine sediment metagenome]